QDHVVTFDQIGEPHGCPVELVVGRGLGAIQDSLGQVRLGLSPAAKMLDLDWPYLLNYVGGPFKDLRVRQAANYAINRQDVVDLLGGTAIPEQAVVPPSMAYYGHP